MTSQIKATEQYFPVVLFIMLHEVGLTFGSVLEILTFVAYGRLCLFYRVTKYFVVLYSMPYLNSLSTRMTRNIFTL